MPRASSTDIPSQRSLFQRGIVRWRRVDGAYAVATGSRLAFAYADREIVLGSTVTLQSHPNFGMWRIV